LGHISISKGEESQTIGGKKMGPAIVIVIRSDGVKGIRLVASSPKEEQAAMDLYRKIQKPINSIRKIIESGNGNMVRRNG